MRLKKVPPVLFRESVCVGVFVFLCVCLCFYVCVCLCLCLCACQTDLSTPRQQMTREDCIKELFMFLTKNYYGNHINQQGDIARAGASIQKRIFVYTVSGPENDTFKI